MSTSGASRSWSESGPYARIFVSVASGPPQPLELRIEERRECTWIYFSGDIDENADFSPLRAGLHGHVVFDLAEVNRINSCGAREWVNLHRDLAAISIALEYHHCSPGVVTQLNAISNFRGAARVASFFAPYVCESCGAEARLLVEVAEDPAATALPAFDCANCGRPLVFDDIPERYLSFLREL